MEEISGIIITDAKGKNLERAIESLDFCREVIIVSDGFENDSGLIKTVLSKASENKNRSFKFYSRKINGNFSGQRNFALDKAKYGWVFFLDDDETVSTALKKELIEGVNKNNGIIGFIFLRDDHFLARFLKHGETSRVRLLRLARKGTGKWSGKVHEEWKVRGRTKIFKEHLSHYPHTLTEFIAKINFYTGLSAAEKHDKGEKAGIFHIIAFPVAKFIKNYIFRLGFFDGTEGFIHAVIMSMHSFLVRVKLWEKEA